MEKHRQVFREALKSPTSGSMDFRVKFASNDDYIWYRSYYTSVTDYSGKVYRIVGRSDSIEKDMRIAADWKKRACHDALTGMLNHDATIEVLKKRIIETASVYNLNEGDMASLYDESLNRRGYFDPVLLKKKAKIFYTFKYQENLPKVEIKPEIKNDEFINYLEKIDGEEFLVSILGDSFKKEDVITLNELYNEKLSEEEELKSEINKLKDPEYLARYTREKYLYSAKDEIIIKIEDKK